MTRPTKLGELTPQEWERVQALFDRFEEACRGDTEPDLALFLPPPDDRVRTVVLHELIKSDLEARWRRGRGRPLEAYLRRFPELGQAAGLPATLVWEEYRVRRHHGDAPSLNSYRQRFPAQFPELERRAKEEPPPPTLVPAVPTIGPPASVRTPVTPAAPTPPPPGLPFGLASADGMLPIGGGYRLIARLGRGTFGEVWRAQAPGGVEVAIKIIFRPIEHEESQRELEGLNLIKNLHHPFLIQTHAFWSLEDRLMIVMELADTSLRDRLKASAAAGRGGLPLDQLVISMRQSCEALDYLHGRGVLHRDIKPDNILLLEGYVKVADMGLARLLEAQRSFSGTTCGSPNYMAPELWSGRSAAASDQYSLAATYVELRRGRPLFSSANMMELMTEHLQRVPDLAGLAPDEQKVLLRALAKAPADRYPSCVEFFHELGEAVAPLLRRPPEPPVPAAPARPPTPASAATPAAAGAAVAVRESPPAAKVDTSEDLDVLQNTVIPGFTPPRPAARRTPRWSWRAGLLVLFALLVPAGVLAVLFPDHLPWHLAFVPVPPTAPVQTTSKKPVPITSKIPEPSRPDFMPADCVAASEPKKVGEQKLCEHIVYTKYGLAVPFVLIVPPTAKYPPFYIMQNKVSNRVFQLIAEQHPGDFQDHSWKMGARVGKEDLKVTDETLDYPVFRLTADEAHTCARLLGGEIPTVWQWDFAAGREWDADEKRWAAKPHVLSPCVGNPQTWELGQFALTKGNMGGPMPVGKANRDRNTLGCEDMASNGFEWTSTDVPAKALEEPKSTPIPFDETRDDFELFLRSQTYLEEFPYRFKEDGGNYKNRYLERQVDISFRVVLTVPPPKPSP